MPYPEEIRWAKFRTVVMCVCALALLAWLVYVRAGGIDFFEPTVRIRTYVPDSTGLSRKTEARLNGIFIGKVTSVKLSDRPQPNQKIEIMLALMEPPSVDLFRRAEEIGISAVMCAPWMGEDVGPDDREGCRGAIERFAETVVDKCR